MINSYNSDLIVFDIDHACVDSLYLKHLRREKEFKQGRRVSTFTSTQYTETRFAKYSNNCKVKVISK